MVRRGFHRTMRFIVGTEIIVVDVTDRRTASRVGDYWNAVQQYLRTGNTHALQGFRGKAIVLEGERYPFVTDTSILNELARQGETAFEDIYADTV